MINDQCELVVSYHIFHYIFAYGVFFRAPSNIYCNHIYILAGEFGNLLPITAAILPPATSNSGVIPETNIQKSLQRSISNHSGECESPLAIGFCLFIHGFSAKLQKCSAVYGTCAMAECLYQICASIIRVPNK